MLKRFFVVRTPDEIYQLLDSFTHLGAEIVEIKGCLHRIVAQDIFCPINLPDFSRSTVDGYAVKAKDTFGASESLPVLIQVVGKVEMGVPTHIKLNDGQAVEIPTGGMLPEGADTVVMVEYTSELDDFTVEISKALAPLENVIQVGDDIKKGELIIAAGRRIRPQDIGVLAAIGKKEVEVFQRPKVAIISTGDEIVDIDSEPHLGKMRDINSYTLGALTEEVGGEPIYLGIARDTFEDLQEKCKLGLDQAEIVVISGGSSVGTRDFALAVINSFPDSELLAHGISISPGKPTILARVGQKALWGLPGHVTSAMIVFSRFVEYLIKRMGGLRTHGESETPVIKARLSRNIASAQGREDYIRVGLERDENGIIYAHPIVGKSGIISTMIKAHGLIKIDMYTEGLERGEWVDVTLFEGRYDIS